MEHQYQGQEARQSQSDCGYLDDNYGWDDDDDEGYNSDGSISDEELIAILEECLEDYHEALGQQGELRTSH